MADEPEVIRQQMEETRSHLTEKLEALEEQVAGTVRATTDTVSETVEAVKETVENVTEAVQETVHSVGEIFDIGLQTQRHPWMVFAGSVAVGCLAAQLFPSAARSTAAECEAAEAGTFRSPGASTIVENGRQGTSSSAAATAPTESREKGSLSWLGEHLSHLKGLAVGTLMGVVRDMVAQALPEAVKDRVAEEIDHFTSALGGEPIRGPIFSGQENRSGESREEHERAGNSPGEERSNWSGATARQTTAS